MVGVVWLWFVGDVGSTIGSVLGFAISVFVSIRLSGGGWRPCRGIGSLAVVVIDSVVESAFSSFSCVIFGVLFDYDLLMMCGCGCLVVVC